MTQDEMFRLLVRAQASLDGKYSADDLTKISSAVHLVLEYLVKKDFKSAYDAVCKRIDYAQRHSSLDEVGQLCVERDEILKLAGIH